MDQVPTTTGQANQNIDQNLQEATPETAPGEKVSLFVHGIHPFATLEDIIKCFKPICDISNIKFKRNKRTGKHHGYAFFDVDSMEIAKELMRKGHVMFGREIHCDLKTDDRAELKKGNLKRIFVGGLSNDTVNRDLEEAFAHIGEVRAAYIIKNLQGQSRGFGYVDFFNIEDATKAGKSKKIKVKEKLVDIRPFARKEKNEEDQRRRRDGNSKNGAPQGFSQGKGGLYPQNFMTPNNPNMNFLNPMATVFQNMPPTLQPQAPGNNFSSIEENFFAQMMMVFQSGMMIGAAQAQTGKPVDPNWVKGQQTVQTAQEKFQREMLLRQRIMTQESQIGGTMIKPATHQAPEPIKQVQGEQKLPPKLPMSMNKKVEVRNPGLSKKTVSLDFGKCREKNTVKEILMTSLAMRKYEDVRDCYFFRQMKSKGGTIAAKKKKRKNKKKMSKNGNKKQAAAEDFEEKMSKNEEKSGKNRKKRRGRKKKKAQPQPEQHDQRQAQRNKAPLSKNRREGEEEEHGRKGKKNIKERIRTDRNRKKRDKGEKAKEESQRGDKKTRNDKKKRRNKKYRRKEKRGGDNFGAGGEGFNTEQN